MAKNCKWVEVKRYYTDANGNKRLGHTIRRISEHNPMFKFYKKSEWWKVIKEYEKPCIKRHCAIHNG